MRGEHVPLPPSLGWVELGVELVCPQPLVWHLQEVLFLVFFDLTLVCAAFLPHYTRHLHLPRLPLLLLLLCRLFLWFCALLVVLVLAVLVEAASHKATAHSGDLQWHHTIVDRHFPFSASEQCTHSHRQTHTHTHTHSHTHTHRHRHRDTHRGKQKCELSLSGWKSGCEQKGARAS